MPREHSWTRLRRCTPRAETLVDRMSPEPAVPVRPPGLQSGHFRRQNQHDSYTAKAHLGPCPLRSLDSAPPAPRVLTRVQPPGHLVGPSHSRWAQVAAGMGARLGELRVGLRRWDSSGPRLQHRRRRLRSQFSDAEPDGPAAVRSWRRHMLPFGRSAG